MYFFSRGKKPLDERTRLITAEQKSELSVTPPKKKSPILKGKVDWRNLGNPWDNVLVYMDFSSMENIALVWPDIIKNYCGSNEEMATDIIAVANANHTYNKIILIKKYITDNVRDLKITLQDKEDDRFYIRKLLTYITSFCVSFIPMTIGLVKGARFNNILAELVQQQNTAGDLTCASCVSTHFPHTSMSCDRSDTFPTGWQPLGCDGREAACEFIDSYLYYCSATLCNAYYSFCDSIADNSSSAANWNVGGVGITLLLLFAYCCSVKWNQKIWGSPNGVSDATATSEIFSETFDEDFQEKVMRVLNKDSDEIPNASIADVLTLSNAAIKPSEELINKFNKPLPDFNMSRLNFLKDTVAATATTRTHTNQNPNNKVERTNKGSQRKKQQASDDITIDIPQQEATGSAAVAAAAAPSSSTPQARR